MSRNQEEGDESNDSSLPVLVNRERSSSDGNSGDDSSGVGADDSTDDVDHIPALTLRSPAQVARRVRGSTDSGSTDSGMPGLRDGSSSDDDSIGFPRSVEQAGRRKARTRRRRAKKKQDGPETEADRESRVINCIQNGIKNWRPDGLQSLLKKYGLPVDCRLSGGRTLVHAASEAGNLQALQWLVLENEVDPSATNEESKTAFDVAGTKRKNAVQKKLKALKQEYDKKRQLEDELVFRKKTENATIIQSYARRYITEDYRQMRESCTYRDWLTLIHNVMDMERSSRGITNQVPWIDVKRDIDLVIQEELDLVGDTILEVGTSDDDEEEHEGNLVVDKRTETTPTAIVAPELPPPSHTIQVTADVLKWIRQQKDEKSRELFAKRLKQLTEGDLDRSLCLKKALKGSKRLVTETKLDKGRRIIWTQRNDEILVWFVCNHDHISRCLERVNLSYVRVGKVADIPPLSGLPSRSDEDSQVNEADEEPEMLASPFSNIPLKIHSLKATEIDNFVNDSDWTPPIKLTEQEENIVRKPGTVLVLGRSGTGKTLCVCNRIDHDRQVHGESVRQLFLARTKRLCKFVQRLVEKTTKENEKIEFKRVVDWIQEMHEKFGISDADRWQEKKHFSYRNFFNHWEEICGDEKKLDQLQVWTQIRSFIKGAFVAAQSGRPLTEEEYSVRLISKHRCRLKEEDRRRAYAIFQRYQGLLSDNGWWDDMDRVAEVVRLVQEDSSRTYETLYDRIYVDEVQDITQAEIGLFFLVSGKCTDSLFLAGDPAQAVSQGVDFRFEEVRLVVHEISKGKERVERWQKLYHNFRSHEGILSVANVVLDCLHMGFPEAAIKLEPDTGLVQGPRPGVLSIASYTDLQGILDANQKIHILVRDDAKEEVRRLLPEHEYALYGIIEAKGLEFSDVLIVDFFSKCSENGLQKAWKQILVNAIPAVASVAGRGVNGAFPQTLELELKLLYTAITRAQNRLLFVETKDSLAFSAWSRLTKAKGIAQPMKLEDVVTEGAKLMTPDEWRVQGIEMAILAEDSEDEGSSNLLERSIAHFQKAGDSDLEGRAKQQLEALKLENTAHESFLVDPNSPKTIEEGSAAILAYLDAGLVQDASRLCKDLCGSFGLKGLGGRIEKLAELSN